jgi:hypothetical protein
MKTKEIYRTETNNNKKKTYLHISGVRLNLSSKLASIVNAPRITDHGSAV